MPIRKVFPSVFKKLLWGDRETWGLVPNQIDPCWEEWQRIQAETYMATQRGGIGELVNDAGYRVMSTIDLAGKRVLEIGAGDIRHLKYLKGKPLQYVCADISSQMMSLAEQKLMKYGISYRPVLLNRQQGLPLEDKSIDVIISFYSLEHLYPLESYVQQMLRVLKPGGLLIGAIPAEGGLAWGGGRMLTTRRYFKKNTRVNLDKIISWEHPNFADHIINKLNKKMRLDLIQYWPLPFIPILDLNLIIKFRYIKLN